MEPRLGQDNEAFCAHDGIDTGEHGHTPLAYTGEVADNLFELVRGDVPSRPDDDVLDPACQVDFALRDIAKVPGVETLAVTERSSRRLLAKVAWGGRRAGALNVALMAVGHLVAGLVDDPHLVAWQRPPASHDMQRGRVAGSGLNRQARTCEGVPVDGIHHRYATWRREAQSDAHFGQPVHRRHRLRTEPVGGKPLGKAAHRLRADRLPTIS